MHFEADTSLIDAARRIGPIIREHNAEAERERRLSRRAGEFLSDLSADDRWLLYATVGAERGLWKMPVAGGEPVEIAKSPRGGALFSRDGKYVQYTYLRQERSRFVAAAGIIPAAGGDLVWSYDAPEGIGEGRWAPSSDALTYVVTREGVSNIWKQSLGDVPAQQITDFKSGRIFSFDWSPDGRELALARGETVGDAVLVSDFR